MRSGSLSDYCPRTETGCSFPVDNRRETSEAEKPATVSLQNNKLLINTLNNRLNTIAFSLFIVDNFFTDRTGR